jgi:hypothetical protein
MIHDLRKLAPELFRMTVQDAIILLLTGSISIPLVLTYCTCLTELNPDTKNLSVKILKVFCRDYILGRRVSLAKKFEI